MRDGRPERRLALWAAAALLASAIARAETPPDTVEQIDLGEEEGGETPPEAETATRPAASPARDRFLLRGWGGSGGAAGLRDARNDHDPSATRIRYDRFVATEHLFAEGSYARGQAFEAALSGLLTYHWALAEDGKPEREDRMGLEASLRQAYLGLKSEKALIRVGQQRIVWGNSDAIRPNDVLNARDLRDRTQEDADVTDLPTPSLRAEVNPLMRLGVQLVLSPFVPDEFDVEGSNWALVQRFTPPLVRALMKASPEAVPEAEEPSLIDPRAWCAGAAVKVRPGESDVNLYYQYGYDRTPLFHTDLAVREALAAMSPGALNPDALAEALAAGEPTTGRYLRRHHFGVNAQTSAGSFVLRQDVALDTELVVLKTDLDGIALPAVQAVAGVEYQTGQLDQVILLELHHLQLLGDAPDNQLMLVRTANTTAVATVRWKIESFLLDAQLAQGLHPTSTIFRPELGWKRDHLDLRIGVLLLSGSARTYARHYTESSSAYATVKYRF